MVVLGVVDDSSPSFVFNTPLHYHIADVVIIIEKAKLHNDIDYSMYKVAKGDLQYHHYYYHHHHHYYHHYHRYYSLSIIITIILITAHNHIHHHQQQQHHHYYLLLIYLQVMIIPFQTLFEYYQSSKSFHVKKNMVRYSCKEEYLCLIITIIHST